MNVPELEAPNVELRRATEKVAKAAEIWLRVDRETKGSNVGCRLGMTLNQLADTVDAMKAVRTKWGMDKHVFLWSHLDQVGCCEYCGLADYMEGADYPCADRLASFTK